MNSGKMSVQRASILLASMLVGSSLFGAADDSVRQQLHRTQRPRTVTAQSQDDRNRSAESRACGTTEAIAVAAADASESTAVDRQSIGHASGTSSAPAQRHNLGNVASLTPVLPAPVPMPVFDRDARPRLRVLRAQPRGGSNPCEAVRRKRGPGISAAGQRLHRSHRLYGSDARSGATRTRHRAWVPTSAAFPITTPLNGQPFGIPLQHPELAARFARRRRLEGRPLHRLQRVRLQRNQRIGFTSPFPTAPLSRVFACSGSTSARARSNSSPDKAGAC